MNAGASDLTDLLLPHLDAAHNLARWLMRNRDEAEDVVQEAFTRAVQYARGFRGGDARAWLLAIVRNTAFRTLRKARWSDLLETFDDDAHEAAVDDWNPEELLLRKADRQLVATALAALPDRFREILVLREVEELSYKELSQVLGVPIGTVMSTLSRARDRLRHTWVGLVAATLPASDERVL